MIRNKQGDIGDWETTRGKLIFVAGNKEIILVNSGRQVTFEIE